RANNGDHLPKRRENAENDRAWQPHQEESDAASNANDQHHEQLAAHPRAERVFELVPNRIDDRHVLSWQRTEQRSTNGAPFHDPVESQDEHEQGVDRGYHDPGPGRDDRLTASSRRLTQLRRGLLQGADDEKAKRHWLESLRHDSDL